MEITYSHVCTLHYVKGKELKMSAHDFDDLILKSSHPSYWLWNMMSPWLSIFDCEIVRIIAHAMESL